MLPNQLITTHGIHTEYKNSEDKSTAGKRKRSRLLFRVEEKRMPKSMVVECLLSPASWRGCCYRRADRLPERIITAAVIHRAVDPSYGCQDGNPTALGLMVDIP